MYLYPGKYVLDFVGLRYRHRQSSMTKKMGHENEQSSEPRRKRLAKSYSGPKGRGSFVEAGVKKLEFEYWDRLDEDWDSDWEVASEDFELGPGGLQVPEEVTDEDKELQLPWRVKIRLTLIDEDRKELVFETQTALYMREALDFTYGGTLNKMGGKKGASPFGKSLPSSPRLNPRPR